MSGEENKRVFRGLFIVNFLVCLGFGIVDFAIFMPIFMHDQLKFKGSKLGRSWAHPRF
jgi:hypothetical protein